jgi:hypothetical protein
MLQLINYDLPDHNYDALQAGVAQAGGGIHLLNGPWVYGADKSPREVLMTVVGSLKEAARRNDDMGEKYKEDKLFVFPVKMGEISTGRNLEQQPIEPHEGAKVIAVAYVLRNPSGLHHDPDDVQAEHRDAVTGALNDLGVMCHPLESLWVVKTDLSAHEVHLALEKAVPLNPKDELMVAEVNLEALMNGYPVKGAEKGLDPKDHGWLVEAGVL